MSYINAYQKPTMITDYYKDGRHLFPNTNPETYINGGIVFNTNYPQPATNYFGIKKINNPEPYTNYIPIQPNKSGPPIRWSPYKMTQHQYNPWSG